MHAWHRWKLLSAHFIYLPAMTTPLRAHAAQLLHFRTMRVAGRAQAWVRQVHLGEWRDVQRGVA